MGVVTALVLAAAVALGLRQRAGDDCGGGVTSLAAAESTTPFLDEAGMQDQPDEDRDRVVDSLSTAPAPFGPVVGAVGYHYEQWAQLSAYAQGIGVRTRDNPDFTMLDDDTLRPLWSVQVDTRRSTYDANDATYLVATMPKKGPPDLVGLDADTGKRRWCGALGGPHVDAADPFATQLLDDGGVVVLGPGSGGSERITRLDDEGNEVWARAMAADEGDFLGALGDGLLVAGGRAQFRLADAAALAERRAGTSLRAVDLDDGRSAWEVETPDGVADHVIGVADGLTVISRAGAAGQRLVAFDSDGAAAWSVDPKLRGTLDTALRAGRVLVRVGNRWAAYDAATGRLLWRRTTPTTPQFLPYGFQLDDVPLLDDDHAVLGTTTGLRVLDLRTGAFTATAPLPTDGINTTYWPYHVTVSEGHVAVATNTSAVVMSRR